VDNVKELIPFDPELPLAVSTWEEAPEELSDEAKRAWDRTAYHLKKHFLSMLNEEVDTPAAGGTATGPQRVPDPDAARPPRRAPRSEPG